MGAPRLYGADDYRRRNPLASDKEAVDYLPGRRSSKEQEDGEFWRSPFRRDYARLVHSPAFRRLQGKTQLFGSTETDFFRNRLAHSIEVAQIGKSIAIQINKKKNKKFEPFQGNGCAIDADLVEVACLAHDLGHPPFGHNGEAALNEMMRSNGGFEGNAQTLRILTRLEKKYEKRGDPEQEAYPDASVDKRFGLNPTARTMAGVLKYDREIKQKTGDEIQKGYYADDAEAVRFMKKCVCGDARHRDFQTIECSIMDCADDIAYSTYDLEDAFKAGFITPIDLISSDRELLEEVVRRANLSLREVELTSASALELLYDFFSESLLPDEWDYAKGAESITDVLQAAIEIYRTSKKHAADGYHRSAFTSKLVGLFIRSVDVDVDNKCLALSRALIPDEYRALVELLKHYTFCKLISAPELKLVEHRGKEIVRRLFTALLEDGDSLMPKDQQVILAAVDPAERPRVVCDFIAGMTDRYALEFYARLFSENAATVFKPV